MSRLHETSHHLASIRPRNILQHQMSLQEKYYQVSLKKRMHEQNINAHYGFIQYSRLKTYSNIYIAPKSNKYNFLSFFFV